MNRLFTVLRHEFKVTAANKGFVIITIIGPFLIAAVALLPSLLIERSTGQIDPGTTVAVVGANQTLLDYMGEGLSSRNLTIEPVNSVESATARVREGEVQGALVLPENYLENLSYRYLSQTGTDISISESLRAVVGEYVVRERMSAAGLDPARVRELTAQPSLSVQKVTESGEAQEQDFGTIIAMTIVFVMMIYMTILFYGQIIGRSVLVEKTEKTVEIILSSVSPRELLFGKILGKGLAGLLQYAIWIGVALLITQWLAPEVGISLPSGLEPAVFAFLLLFFILAFFIFATGYAAIGAGASDEQHMGQLGMPLILMLVIPMVMVSAILMDPGGGLSQFLSFFPFTAPIVMFVRVMVQMPPVWEILLSVGIMVATIIVMVLLSAKIFRVGILMTGKRFKLSEILSWVRA